MTVETSRATEWGPWPIKARQLSMLVAAFVLIVGVWWLLGSAIVGSGVFRSLDTATAEWMVAQRTPTLNALSDLASGFSDTITVVIAVAILGAAFSVLWRRWEETSLLLVGLTLEVSTFVTTAFLVGRERPMVEKLDPAPPTSGFPSGHMAAAVMLYCGLAYLVFRHTEHRGARTGAVLVAVIAPISVALSRMYRGMHYLTDVSAGALLGVLCLLVAIFVVGSAVDEHNPERPKERSRS